MIVVPVTFLLIFMLLFAAFHSARLPAVPTQRVLTRF